jgi:hypothetical protein
MTHTCEEYESCLLRIGLCGKCAQTTAKAFRQQGRLGFSVCTYFLCSDKCSNVLGQWQMEGAQCPEGKDLQ